MFRATRIRIYPNESQAVLLAKQFGCARWVWNEALAENQRVYKETGKGLNYFDLNKRLPALKQQNEWLKEAVAQSMQCSLRNLARSFVNFFQGRTGYPQFKTKNSKKAVQYPQDVKFRGNGIFIPKLGVVKASVHRKIEGKLHTTTVIQESCGHYYASVLVDDGVSMPPVDLSLSAHFLGIDVGITDIFVTSSGTKVSNPRHLRKAEKNLKRKQRKMSKKTKGSKSREKARLLVARAHERIKNSRRDFLEKYSTRLVSENQAIAVESLNVKGMMKSPKLAKAIADVSWGQFNRMLEYKCARQGKPFVKIGRFFPSTRTCSSCGTTRKKMPLSQRFWQCECGLSHDRDINAAKNIAAEGWRIMASGIGASASGGKVSQG